MRNRKIILIAVVASVFITIVSCGNKEKAPVAAKQQALPFPVTQLQPQTVTGYAEYPVSIEGIVSSDVRAKTTGYIQKVLVDEGARVRKGQPLFKLETQALSQDAEAAKAQVNVAQVEVNKLKPLVEKNIISQVQLETAKANLAQAKANYSSIVANISYATVKSPVDGYVGSINFREGALVSAADATPLTTVSDISKVYAFFSLNETDYLDFIQNAKGKNLEEKLKNYPEVSLILANGSTYNVKGKIQTSTGQVNQNTGTISLRAIFDNPNEILTNGSSGKIKIPSTYNNAIVIPQSATYEQQGKVMVFTIDENNSAKSKVVKVQAKVDNLYVIESGIDANTKIIASGVSKLRDGMPITPQEIPFEKATEKVATLFRN
ncbi:efflux transporter periplasmic adaptor subunit [Seonamhaeicola sp. S2-3]|uniref:efflux RND transporter periplasmic adaptor subunit n=1 Tax=Seonamhaeicola sp. S2-3 TaxID=1936081 RepID=UPI0009729B20|nr:efflux RND transporter periplasmic adaptor subunit [Seonamhaeicola sp. S2-3]APY10842.1 efflux transporter periplasmic adaptor subunit [Seonamhaeicola sp. S2-3]